ncbi:MAG: hypothetical protein ACHQ1D_01125 [Nitrososphaerales archaeon]
MVDTGCKRWDELPAYVGKADVDVLRTTYMAARNIISKETEIMLKCKKKLDSIWKKYQKDGVKDEN